MADAGGERRPVEQCRRQHVHQVEPAARLADVLDDEVTGEMSALEPLLVLERVVHLRVGHRAGVEPDVEHVGDPAHGGTARRVVRVRARQVIDVGPVQIRDGGAEVGLQFGDRAVDVDPRVQRVVGLPDRDRTAPEAVPADRPVAGVGQPLAELAVLDVLRDPGDLLVELDHPVTELGHLDEPGRDRLVDQRVPAAPAVRIAVLVGLPPDQVPAALQVVDDERVGVEDLHARVRRDDREEAGPVVDSEDRRDSGGLAGDLVLLAVGGGHVHDAGAVLGGDVVGRDHPEGRLGAEHRDVRQEAEQRLVGPPDELAALEPVDHVVGDVLAELAGVGGQPRFGQDVPLRGPTLGGGLDDDVVQVRPDRHRQVAGQRPRSGGPGHQPLARGQLHPDRHRRVLTLLVDVVVHLELVVGQRRLVDPAVRQHPLPLVDVALVVERLEGPQDALHVRRVESLVVVVEVDPASLLGDVVLPLVGVAHHRLPTGVVELLDAHPEDLAAALDAQLPLGLQLGRQTVGVPAESTLDLLPAHGLVARDDVLDVAGQQVAVVRKAVGERGAVVEDELVGAVLAGIALVDGRLEGVVRLPVRQRCALGDREVGPGGDLAGAGERVGGAVVHLGVPLVHSRHQATGTTQAPVRRAGPRYHPACPGEPGTTRRAPPPRRAAGALPAVTGQVPFGSSERAKPPAEAGDLLRRSSEWLAGDGRVDADYSFDSRCYSAPWVTCWSLLSLTGAPLSSNCDS